MQLCYFFKNLSSGKCIDNEEIMLAFLGCGVFYFASKGVVNAIPTRSPIRNRDQRSGIWYLTLPPTGILHLDFMSIKKMILDFSRITWRIADGGLACW
jgi:hypothetical protein